MPRTQGFKIRYVKETDFPVILQMVTKVIAKVFPEDKVSVDKVRDLFDKGLENEAFTCIVLVDPEDTPKGYILACISDLYFHSRKTATCLSIWIDEEHRNHSLDMLRAFSSWGKYKGAELLVISEFNNLSPKGTGKVFQVFGFNLVEKQYWKDLR